MFPGVKLWPLAEAEALAIIPAIQVLEEAEPGVPRGNNLPGLRLVLGVMAAAFESCPMLVPLVVRPIGTFDVSPDSSVSGFWSFDLCVVLLAFRIVDLGVPDLFEICGFFCRRWFFRRRFAFRSCGVFRSC